jgi:hypothetical protein
MDRRDIDGTEPGRQPVQSLAGGVWAICEKNSASLARDFQSVAKTFLDAVSAAETDVAMAAPTMCEAEHQIALKPFRLQVERACDEAKRAGCRYGSVEPENWLVARLLETDWEDQLQKQKAADAQWPCPEGPQPLQLSNTWREQICALWGELKRVWIAPTTDRDRQEMLHSRLEEVKTKVLSDRAKAHGLYLDTVFTAGLNQPRTKTTGSESFTTNRIVLVLSTSSRYSPDSAGSMTNSSRASKSRPELPGTFAWPNNSGIWSCRKSRWVAWRCHKPCACWTSHGMQRVKRGELCVVHARCGKQKGLRIRVLDSQPQLFDPPSSARV